VRIIKVLLESVSSVTKAYWASLRWTESALLPTSVKRYFSFTFKRQLVTLPLLAPTTQGLSYRPWRELRRELLENGGWPAPRAEGEEGEEGEVPPPPSLTPLHLACHEGDLPLLKELCRQQEPATILAQVTSVQGPNGMTPLMMACYNGQADIFRYLVALGCEVDVKKRWNGHSFLKLASDCGHTFIKSLLEETNRDPLFLRTRSRMQFNFPVETPMEFMVTREDNTAGDLFQASQPFTLHELILSLKARFHVHGAAELSVKQKGYDSYMRVTSLDQLHDKADIRIANTGASLWTQPPNKKWERPPKRKYVEELVIREGGNTLDKELWDKLVSLLDQMSPAFTPLTQIKRAVAIRNDFLRQGFETHRSQTQLRHDTLPDFKKDNWIRVGVHPKERQSRTEEDLKQREKFMEYLKDYRDLFEENEDSTVFVSFFFSQDAI